jgi:hypothetical protein
MQRSLMQVGKYAGAHTCLAVPLSRPERDGLQRAWGAGARRRLGRGHRWRAGVCHQNMLMRVAAVGVRLHRSGMLLLHALAAATSLRTPC